VRFVSFEPLLEHLGALYCESEINVSYLLGEDGTDPPIPGLDWVIGGGESGPGARPYNVEWIRAIVKQCQAANAPVFVKQVGSHAVGPDECWNLATFASRKAGDRAEWPEDRRVREYP